MPRYGLDFDRDRDRGWASGDYGRDFRASGYGDDFTSGSRSYNTMHRDWHIERGGDLGGRDYPLDRGWSGGGWGGVNRESSPGGRG
ncbi:MAG TPA: hypothetical protein VF092_02480 [Longimicrobium sp.]